MNYNLIIKKKTQILRKKKLQDLHYSGKNRQIKTMRWEIATTDIAF